ncbi:rhomboid family intramembrane serine protease [Aestuariibacter salexigens]|uniref:rhomboid family intramembrane serine protease n=1 Tax=Aestuariibacter salexigens TaxID=226010 RepID=UPI000420869E|nr:rhomboid family intramembrane serine protease [Aestuariibacter salexigens]
MQASKVSLSRSVLFSLLMVSVLWVIKSSELMFHVDLSGLGLQPLVVSDLWSIFTAPIVHASLEHLFNNTLPLLLLLAFLHYGYPNSRWKVIGTVWVLSGIGVWLFAREANHLGASGINHGVFFFLFVVSLFRRDKSSIAIMMIAFFMYGGMTMTIFPREEHISFEYHFFGAVAGTLAALLWRHADPMPEVKRYDWEREEPDDDDPVIGDEWQLSEHQSSWRDSERHCQTERVDRTLH